MRLQFGQQKGAGFGRARLAHDSSPMDRVLLARRDRGVGVGSQIFWAERLGMLAVSVEHQEQRGSLLHDAHSGVGMPMNSSLMTFGLSKEALQVEIILGEIREVAPGK